MENKALPRQLKISVLRFNPQEPGSVPRMQTYEIEEAEGMTLFIALMEIREKQDPSLEFDFVCRAGICGSCGMMINGSPTLACRTLTKDLGTEITLAPLPVLPSASTTSERPSRKESCSRPPTNAAWPLLPMISMRSGWPGWAAVVVTSVAGAPLPVSSRAPT